MISASATIFFLIALLILSAGHYYLWRRMVRDTELSGRARRIATWGIVLAAVVLVPIWILSRVLPRDLLGIPSLVAFSWKGLLYYALLILAGFEILRLARRLLSRKSSKPTGSIGAQASDDFVTRRAFLARTAAGSAVVGSSVISSFGIRSAFYDLQTPTIQVRLPRLPPALSGLRVAVISDAHLGPVLGEDFVKQMVEKTNLLRPDLVAITGDLVDGSVNNLAHDVAPLAGLKSRFGTFFITGNHEYYSGVEQWLQHMPTLDIQVLGNRRVSIGDGKTSLDLVGVHDYRGSGSKELLPDLPAALAGRDPERECVLLAHQPVHIHEASDHDVGLQISGHTHGGQIWPFGVLTGLTQPYIHGLHQHSTNTQIYVTRGTGFWGPPIRVLAPAEISLLVLTT